LRGCEGERVSEGRWKREEGRNERGQRSDIGSLRSEAKETECEKIRGREDKKIGQKTGQGKRDEEN
jgi:hypothetical protein